MTDIDPDRTLASLVEETPAYARAFESLGLDYCCEGDRTLATACDQADLAVDDVRARLRETRDREDADADDWEGLADLADHVVETHHDYLREELPALQDLVAKVARVHGENHPELRELEAEFSELAEEMREHIEEEETELFPVVGKLDRGESPSTDEAARLREAIRTFEDDHAATADRLDRIAELTDGYAVPGDACASYRSMLDRLDRLERDTHMHVHRENNVLFPRAEERLPTGPAEA
ncbi:iron-sulfur cluster repair di-iron protein [Halosimplex halophilum]|uniref:iron-sulfur cluster repair di-iron protein n=1 Tax=Halosimplex halophilum TaxID=2559572 RepID=UPI00107FAAD7|nr:iron-sulfur cluster repair di-iron protein [Halosimplex halophilum]